MSFDSLITQIESQRNSSGQILEISNTSTQDIIDYNNEGNTKKVDAVLFQNFISRDTNKIPNNTSAVNASIVQNTKALELIEYSLIQSQKINALSFIPQEELEKYRRGILFAAESGQVVAFNKGQNILGILVMRGYIHGQIEKTLVSWIWISKESTPQQKQDIVRAIKYFLYKTNREYALAHVHTANLKSLRFFERIGFTPRWIKLK